MLQAAKSRVSNWLQMRAVRRYGSRVGWKIAGRYNEYWDEARSRCRLPIPKDPIVAQAVETYRSQKVVSFHTAENEALARQIAARIDAREAAGERVWLDRFDMNSNENYGGDIWQDFPEVKHLLQGSLGGFLEGYFGCPFKVFLGIMYHSVHEPAGPKSSSLWHSDSGPGTCVNVMFYLDDSVPEDGNIEVLPWGESLSIFERESAEMRRRLAALGSRQASKTERRNALCAWYEEVIRSEFADRIVQPYGKAGLVAAFANNAIHRGGFPRPGRRRRVMLFHFYPSDRPTDWSRYDASGIKKTASYPADPRMEF